MRHRCGPRVCVRSGFRGLHLVLKGVTPGRWVSSAHFRPQRQQLDLLVILYPFGVITEELIRLLHLLELVLLDSLQGGILHLIRMALEDELSVSASDLR